MHRLWARVFCAIMGIRIRVEGLERLPRSHAILAPNHASMFDILILGSLPVHFRWISKRELLYIPFIGLAMKAMGSFFVHRNRSSKDVGVMRQVEDALRGGAIVLIFPEGTRTHTGQLLPFKKGAFKSAQNAGVPIIPIGLLGSFQIAPKNTLPIRWGHDVTVRIGAPLAVPPGASMEEAMEQYRAALLPLLNVG